MAAGALRKEASAEQGACDRRRRLPAAACPPPLGHRRLAFPSLCAPTPLGHRRLSGQEARDAFRLFRARPGMEVRWDWDGRAKVPAPLTDDALAKKKEKERDKKVRGCTSAAAAAAAKKKLFFFPHGARVRDKRA